MPASHRRKPRPASDAPVQGCAPEVPALAIPGLDATSAEALLTLALETTGTGVWELDLEADSARRSFEHDRIFGYDELLPAWNFEIFMSHVVPEDRAHVEAAFRRARQAGERMDFVCRIRRVDGEVRWIRAAGGLTPDGKHLAGVVQDITVLADSEQMLRETVHRAERAVGREDALKRVAGASSALLRPEQLATRIAETVAPIFGAKQVQIRLVNEDKTLLEPGGAYDPDGFLQSLGAMPVDADTETARAYRAGERRVGEDISPRVPEESRRLAARSGVRSYALLPVKVGEETIGVFYMAWGEPRKFPAADITFMEAVVAQFSIGLQNARLYDSQRKRRRRIEALHGVLESGASSLDVRESAQRIVEYLAGHADFDMFSVWLANGSTLELAASIGYPDGYIAMSPTPLSSEHDGAVAFRTSATVVARTVANPAVIDVFARLGGEIGSYVVAPLVAGGRAVGIASFVWKHPQELNSYDIAFYESVAGEIAVVLENARLYQVEHNIAETLQETLVGLPAVVPGVSFSRAYVSASAERGRVGGDFVDLFEVRRPLVGIAIGDVSGKGIGAAVITSLVRNTIRAHAVDGLPPREVAAKTNTVIQRFTDLEAYVTMFFGVLDTRTGRLRYVSAGHPPALLLREGELAAGLPGHSPVLGAFENAPFNESEITLRPGERLVLYTDGVTEARAANGAGFFELDGLKGAVARNGERATPDLARVLMDEVTVFSDGRLRDDAAILVVEPTSLRPSFDDSPRLDL